MDELKLCICGHSASIKQTGRNEVTLRCPNCLLGLKQKTLRNTTEWLMERMISDWNTRPLEDALTTQRDEAVEACKAALEWLEYYHMGNTFIADQLRAVIAKAK